VFAIGEQHSLSCLAGLLKLTAHSVKKKAKKAAPAERSTRSLNTMCLMALASFIIAAAILMYAWCRTETQLTAAELREASLEDTEQAEKPKVAPLSAEEEQTELALSYGKVTADDRHLRMGIDQWFEETASAFPDRVALKFEDREMTYRELDDKILLLASQLRRKGVMPNTFVVLLLRRSIEAVIAIYAVLRAGGAYVPIDSSWPEARIENVLEDTKCTIVITESSLEAKMPSSFNASELVLMDHVDYEAVAMSREDLAASRSPSDLSHCFFTSGSTGKPKGVLIEHAALTKRQMWMASEMPLGATDEVDSVVLKTDYTFGISEWELFWPLQVGARLVIAKPDAHKDQIYLLELLQKEKITAAAFVPSLLHMLIESMDMEGEFGTTHIRYLLCCGEKLPVSLCMRFHAAFQGELRNLMGPTEADMTSWTCPRLDPNGAPPFMAVPGGIAIDNSIAYVLDSNHKLVRTGEKGEHCIASGCARGYLNRPEMTEKQFVADPFRPGHIMYKTGDMVVRDAKGVLTMVGRMDNQVKLRGYRIELGEIESILGQRPSIKQALAVIVGKDDFSKQLVAYVTPESANVAELKDALTAALPSYMVPTHIVPLKAFPLTERGKIDRKKLPAVEASKGNTQHHGPLVKASTRMEKLVEQVWKDALKDSSPISVDAKFRDLGGNSLLAGKVTSLLRKKCRVKMTGTVMYTHPTIQEIAQLIQELGGVDDADYEAVVDKQVDEAEIETEWHGGDATSWTNIGVSFLMPISIEVLDKLQLGIVAVFYLRFKIGFSTVEHALHWLGVIALATIAELVFCVVVSLVVKWGVLGKVTPGNHHRACGNYAARVRFVSQILGRHCCDPANGLFADTVVANWWYRALGVTVGENVSVCDLHTILAAGAYDLITIGDNTTIKSDVLLQPTQIEKGGLLHVNPITIGRHCYIDHSAVITPGTVLPDLTFVGPKSSTGFGGTRDMHKMQTATDVVTQNALRLLVGAPTYLLITTLAQIPVVMFLHQMNVDTWQSVMFAVGVAIYAFVLITPEAYFILTALFKWVVIGPFVEGGEEILTPWFAFRAWIMDHLTHCELYDDATKPWVATEFLAIKQRIMGTKLGKRVQTDAFRCSQHDLVEVGKNVVFGSHVLIQPTDRFGSKRISIDAKANVTDNCVLMPGVHMMEGAILGSNSIGHKDGVFPKYSVSTGNVGGKSILLQTRSEHEIDGSYLFLPPKERDDVLEAQRRHESYWWFYSFNAFILTFGALEGPFDSALQYIGIAAMLAHQPSDGIHWWFPAFIILVYAPFFHIVKMAQSIALKWALIGEWKEGSQPFYGLYHVAFTILMQRLNEPDDGQYLKTIRMMLMGAHIADRSKCIIDGHGFEFDLLHIDEHCVLNKNADLTCHTVENMVLKFAIVKYNRGATVGCNSCVMPGGSIEVGGTLRESSVLLKGETVPAGETYAGLPAAPISEEDLASSFLFKENHIPAEPIFGKERNDDAQPIDANSDDGESSAPSSTSVPDLDDASNDLYQVYPSSNSGSDLENGLLECLLLPLSNPQSDSL